MKEETIDLEEAIALTAKLFQCSEEEAYRIIEEATLNGELPTYIRLDDGFLRRVSPNEILSET